MLGPWGCACFFLEHGRIPGWIPGCCSNFCANSTLKIHQKKLKTLTKNLWGLQALKNHQRGPSNKGHCRSKPKKSSPQKRRFFGSFSVLIAICGPRRFRIFSVHLRSRPGFRFRREVGIDSGQWVSNYMDPPAP